MGFSKLDYRRNAFMLTGSFARKGYDWWWHSFTAVNRTTREECPFFIEYFVCNPALGGKEPVLGQLPANKEKGIRPSYLMVKAGCWGKNKKQLHRFFGWDDVKVTLGAPFELQAGDCSASDTVLCGSVSLTEEEVAAHPEYMCDAGSMEWHLTVEKQIAYNVGYGASGLFRAIKAFEMYWHAEGIKSAYEGTIIMDGEIYDVIPKRCFGYADKNWGRGFTTPWVWLSSNCLYSVKTGKLLKNSAFEVGGGRPKIYFLPLNRKLLGGMYYEGEEFEFNFSKFWQKPATRFAYNEDEKYIYWKVWQESSKAVIKINVRCKKADMLLVNYEAPDGSKRHNRLWNGGNGIGRIQLFRKTSDGLELVDDMKATHIGCEYGEYDS